VHSNIGALLKRDVIQFKCRSSNGIYTVSTLIKLFAGKFNSKIFKVNKGHLVKMQDLVTKLGTEVLEGDDTRDMCISLQ